MAKMKIYGLPDILARPELSWRGAAGASASMALSNLETEEPSEFWRSQGLSPDLTYFQAYTKFSSNVYGYNAVQGYGLINHNLLSASAQIRIVGSVSEPPLFSSAWDVFAPTGIVASTNKDGTTETAVDDGGWTPDGLWMGPSNPDLDWSVTFSFPTPGFLTAGEHEHAFWVYCKVTDSKTPMFGQNITAYLSESGTTVRNLGTKKVWNSTGQWLYWTFDCSELTIPGGTNLELKLTMTHGETATNDCISLGIVNLHANNSTFSGGIVDTGWVSIGEYIGHPNASPGANYRLPAERTAGECFVYDAGSSSAGVLYHTCYIREDFAPLVDGPDTGYYDPASLVWTPPTYVQVGKFLGCPEVFTPGFDFTYGDIDGVVDLSSAKVVTDGGQTFNARRGTKRVANIPLLNLSKAEQAWLKDRLLRRRGASMPVVVEILPGDSLEGAALTFYATLRAQEHFGGFSSAAEGMRTLTLAFEEKL